VVDDPGFQAAALACALLAVLVVVRGRARDVRGAPAIAVLAALVGWSVDYRLDARLVVALAALALGAAFGPRRGSVLVRIAALVPGAALLGIAVPDRVPVWVALAAAALTLAVAAPAETLDRLAPRLAPLVFAVAVAGIYVCVPEADAARPALGAFGVAALLAVLPGLDALPGSSAAAVGLLAWTTAVGGYPRPGSVVGGLGCIVAALLVRLAAQARGWRLALAGVVAAGLVVYCARVAGFEQSAGAALALAVPGFAVALGVYAVVLGRSLE